MSKNKKQIWKCEVCGQTFFNWKNYFEHQQKCREWSKLGIRAVNKALEMLKCTLQHTFDVITNNARYEILQDEDGICYPTEFINMDITCKYQNKEFQLHNYIFNSEDYTNPTNIYFKIMQHYILPILAGYNSYEEYQFKKLSKEEQDQVNAYLYQY